MIKLSKIAKVTAGQAAPKEFSDIGFPFIRAGHIEELISGNKLESLPKVSDEVAKKKRLKLIPKGTILFAKSGMSATKNRVYITDKQSYFVSHLAGILPSEEFSSSYLARYLSWYNPAKLILDSAYPSIRLADINNLKIPLPPLEQQKKIAAILDAADTYRQKTKALITKYDELTQSLFLDMFGDPVRNPKGWEKSLLKSVSDKITDGTHFSPKPQSEGFPYITAKHVKSYGLDFYSKPTYVSEDAHKEIYKRCTPEYGDILYIKDGATTGIACINTFKEPFSMLSSLALIKPSKSVINNYYLCFWLNNLSIKRKLLSEFMSGAAIQRYTLTKINSFKLIVPPISLQNQFAERVKAIEAQKAQAQASLVQADNLFNSLLQRAFKGELV
jgi:type I restriction enzyme S subunit